MSYYEDTLEGIVEFCENEGQPCESLKRIVELHAAFDVIFGSKAENLRHSPSQTPEQQGVNPNG